MADRANQIARELTVSDYAIWRSNSRPTTATRQDKKLYLQLKPGDSHLRPRKRDDQRMFRIENVRHAAYWADQDFPVCSPSGILRAPSSE
ncbi:MAG: hypothetical protein ACRDYA_03005 [Egibacteraceae bacterium]